MAGLGRRVVMGDYGELPEQAADEPRPITRPHLVARSDEVSCRLARLARTIEVEIVPRLVLARRAGPVLEPPTVAWMPTAQDVGELAALVLAADPAMASSHVEAMRVRGASIETLYLDLLAPTARHLGDLWEADLCDFTQVTIGLCRLQQVLRELSHAFHSEMAQPVLGRRVLLIPVPGEQHSFGLFMVAEFFRRAGWDVCGTEVDTRQDLVRTMRDQSFAVVGFSASCGTRLDLLAASIRAARRASRNRGVGVMVGGPLFTGHPELVAHVGADATARDARQAPLQAQNLLSLLTRAG